MARPQPRRGPFNRRMAAPRGGPRRRLRRIASSGGDGTDACRSMILLTMSQMPGRRIFPSRKAATATSLAAFMTAGRVPPVSPARRARSRAGKTSRRGASKVELAESGEVERAEACCGTRSGQVTAYWIGKAHVGVAELREHAAVDELDHGVHDALRMDDDVDARHFHVEEPAGFDHFEAFVEEGGGIDGDLAAHVPGGMLERLLDGGGGDLLARPVRNGPPLAVRMRRLTSSRARGLRGTGRWRCARCPRAGRARLCAARRP